MPYQTNSLFRFLASLKLAFVLLLFLAAILAGATIVESRYGAAAAKTMVYGSGWFSGLLFLLFVNILCATLIRYPWHKKHIGFVLTHAALLLILIGSIVTQQWGIDGSLSIMENQSNNTVILPQKRLTIIEENTGTTRQYPIPESGRATTGTFLQIDIGKNDRLIVDSFLPRAKPRFVTKPSPIDGIGKPSIKVSLFNSRFHIEEQLQQSEPNKPAELMLGPVAITLEQLWQPALNINPAPRTKSKRPRPIGHLIVSEGGRQHRIPIDAPPYRWHSVEMSPYQILIERYFPYAVVDDKKKQLVNKSDFPGNPAVTLKLRSKDSKAEEKHIVFANFPELPTLRGPHGAQTNSLPVSFRMTSYSRAIPTKNQKRLKFVQSADNRSLHYTLINESGKITGTGKVVVGEPVQTDWMQLKFTVTEWYPTSMNVLEPLDVDQTRGANTGNLVSAIRIQHEVISENTRSINSRWLLEGGAESFVINRQRYVVHFANQRMELPFGVFLSKFTIGKEVGSERAASYESTVVVKDLKNNNETTALISMNDPLKYKGYTFYQASYKIKKGQPKISIFSVNRDPGRLVKYAGSILLILGILFMFFTNPSQISKFFQTTRENPC